MAGDNEEVVDRPQGVLTRTEREILLGDESFEARGREARSRIRRRLGDALVDYIVLEEELPQKDIETVFAPEGDTPEEVQDLVERHLVEGLQAQVRFVYRAAEAGKLDAEKLITDAVDEAKGSRIEKLARQFERDPESLTIAEMKMLLSSGEVPQDRGLEALSHVLDPPAGGSVSNDVAATLLDGWSDDADDEE